MERVFFLRGSKGDVGAWVNPKQIMNSTVEVWKLHGGWYVVE